MQHRFAMISVSLSLALLLCTAALSQSITPRYKDVWLTNPGRS